jgi:four helix bundle protein
VTVPYNSFEEMPVWQKAMDMAVEIFHLTERLPRREDYGLTSQIRRSALSVAGNIAEGFGRKHIKEKMNFYYDARGSLSETKSHLIYGYRVHYFEKIAFDKQVGILDDIWKQLNTLINSLKGKT